MSSKNHQFQAEVKQILDLVIHSLYSNKEIFLRELISNASDAIDKLKFQLLTDKSNINTNDLEIRLVPDNEVYTLKIIDNGIGMTKQEVITNLGTIAHSGTKEFLKNAEKLKQNPELIGQFGVGFYSAFMVAKKVVVHTQKFGTKEGVLWTSTGDGEYTIEEVPRPEGYGTSITLFLKEQEKGSEDQFEDFTNEYTLKSTVKKYSDFISHPIKMKTVRKEQEKDSDGKPIEGKYKDVETDEILNSQQAIWLKSPKDVNEEEYKEFYHHVSHDWNEPLSRIHFKAEGMQEFSALLYIPKQKPFNFDPTESKFGPSLYVKRVFIMNDCEELLPRYFRFVKGVVDSSDLSLNVSREILQKNIQVKQISKGLTNKVFKHFAELLEQKRSDYETMWENFGTVIKEGLASDFSNREKLQDLALFKSTFTDKWTSFKEYESRMPEKQKEIYYVSGNQIEQLKDSPLLERFKEKGFEVLFATDAIDEILFSNIGEYNKKPIKSVIAEDLSLDSESEKKEKEEKIKDLEEKFSSLKSTILTALEQNVREVKFSDRLVDSPVCLVSGKGDLTPQMERIMKAMGQAIPKTKRVMELNPSHPIFEKMSSLNTDLQKDWAEILYNQALLNEGSPIENPTKLSKQIEKLMLN